MEPHKSRNSHLTKCTFQSINFSIGSGTIDKLRNEIGRVVPIGSGTQLLSI